SGLGPWPEHAAVHFLLWSCRMGAFHPGCHPIPVDDYQGRAERLYRQFWALPVGVARGRGALSHWRYRRKAVSVEGLARCLSGGDFADRPCEELTATISL